MRGFTGGSFRRSSHYPCCARELGYSYAFGGAAPTSAPDTVITGGQTAGQGCPGRPRCYAPFPGVTPPTFSAWRPGLNQELLTGFLPTWGEKREKRRGRKQGRWGGGRQPGSASRSPPRAESGGGAGWRWAERRGWGTQCQAPVRR